MPYTLSKMQYHFKSLGKFIYASELATKQAEELHEGIVGVVGQPCVEDGDGTEDWRYIISYIFVPALDNHLYPALKALRTVPVAAKKAIETTLRNEIAIALGLTIQAPLDKVGTALIATMNDLNGKVAPATNNPNGFAAYFASNFGITLPTSTSPTILDSWITPTLLA